MPASKKYGLTALAALIFFVLMAIAPSALLPHLTVLALAIVIGYYVIGNVHHALHTPLMSVTNAISGIIVVGGLLEIGRYTTLVTIVSGIGILLASINIFGGFSVTRRMLSMFSRS
jgi:NAD(P) transhydrogenase subunit alpha